LPAVFTAVFHRAVLMAKRTLFINIGKKPPKGLYDKVSGGFYHLKCLSKPLFWVHSKASKRRTRRHIT
ncbi:hypothetical protein, partial [Neisseria iguanae]|uniref:hypothetical protein n=1 Tax=Neisseria iguanae TaxID=90242 RepID=UPI001B808D74